MTNQVRNTYGRHRRGTWGLALLLIIAVAVVAIPFASGAAAKYYTLSAPSETIVCLNGEPTSVTVTLKNLAKQPLGSANLTVPTNVDANSLDGTPTIDGVAIAPASAWLDGDTIKLRNLNLAQGKSVVIKVKVTGSETVGPNPRNWVSVVKQANDFSDAGPGNLFVPSPTSSPPTIKVISCYVKLFFVSGGQPKDAEVDNTITTVIDDPIADAPTVEVRYKGTETRAPMNVTDGVCVSLAEGPGELSPQAPACFNVVDGVATLNGLSINEVGTYRLSAVLAGVWNLELEGDRTATSEPFNIQTAICGTNEPSCLTLFDGGQSGADVKSGRNFAVVLNRGTTGADCTRQEGDVWNQVYLGNDPSATFPSVDLRYKWGANMLQAVYYIRNDLWVQTTASRGNNDAEFCFEGVHELTPNVPITDAFPVKPGSNPDGYSRCVGTVSNECTLFYGVLPTVANAQKVKTNPAVCASSVVNLEVEPGVFASYRSWTICIPYDWDPKLAP